jgi:hypothetical protein
MSPKPGTYSLTSPNAVYANRALKHAYWALGASGVAAALRSVLPAEAPLDIVWGLWMLLELPQIVYFGVRSVKAGIRDGRVLAISIREGAFVSVPEEEYL